jgi:TRAP-type C4-dicarboxylate transport system permease small subunit
MFCIYLAIAFFFIGICIWIAGSIVEKQKKKQTKSKRKKYQRLSDKLRNIANIVFVLCAITFVFGFIILLGGQSSQMKPL